MVKNTLILIILISLALPCYPMSGELPQEVKDKIIISELDISISDLAIFLSKLDISISDLAILLSKLDIKTFEQIIRYINSIWVADGIAEGNWAIVWKTLREEKVSDDKIQALEDYCKALRSFYKVEVTRFREFKMSKSTKWTGGEDENAYVVKTYEEEVKEGDVIIFDVLREHADMVSAVKFVEKNRDKIAAIIVGWESGRMNNFSKKRPSTDPEIMGSYRKLFASCKSVAPHIPIGVVVCKSRTWKAWLGACELEYDFLAIWDIHKLRAKLKRYERFFPGEQLFIAGMNARGRNPEYGGVEYQKYIKKLKASEEFVGSIWIKSQ